MSAVTIVVLAVIAILTVAVLSLLWLVYSSCVKAYKVEVASGSHDDDIIRTREAKRNKAGRVVGAIASYVLFASFAALFVVGVVHRANGGYLPFGDQTALVIKSGSMSSFYDESLEEEYRALGYDSSLQFDIGDVCLFEGVPADVELIEGEVYGYRRKNIVITHRLTAESADGLYEFRGDNNPVSDGVLVERADVAYHYTGRKVPGVGAFVLYAQSPFGVWSLSGMICVAIGSEVVQRIVSSTEDARYCELFPDSEFAEKRRAGRGKRP